MIRDFFDGISSYSKALQLLSKLRLWKFVIVPGLIGMVLGGAILFAAWGLSDNVGNLLISWYPWEWGRGILDGVATVFGGLLVLAVGLIVFKQLVMVVTGPFMSPLSERVERELLGKDGGTSFSFKEAGFQVVRGLRIAVRNLIRELFLTIGLLILGLIPFFSPFIVVAIFLVQAYYFGFGNFDFALERHHGVKGTVQFVRNNRPLALGNGVVTTLTLMTLVGFLFILPIGVVAATVEMVKRLEKKEAVSKAENKEFV